MSPEKSYAGVKLRNPSDRLVYPLSIEVLQPPAVVLNPNWTAKAESNGGTESPTTDISAST